MVSKCVNSNRRKGFPTWRHFSVSALVDENLAENRVANQGEDLIAAGIERTRALKSLANQSSVGKMIGLLEKRSLKGLNFLVRGEGDEDGHDEEDSKMVSVLIMLMWWVVVSETTD